MMIRKSLSAVLMVLTLGLVFTTANADDKEPANHLEETDSAAARTWTALNDRISIDQQTPSLTAMLERISELANVNIVVRQGAFALECVSDDQAVRLSLHNVRVRSALKILLEKHRLTLSVMVDGRVVIESPRHHPDELTVRTYDVGDLFVDRSAAADEFDAATSLKSFRDLIVDSIRPQTWEDSGGAGSITMHPESHSLVIRQTRVAHAETNLFLEQLRSLANRSVPSPDTSVQDELNRQRILTRLNETNVPSSFDDTPLAQALAFLAEAASFNLVIDAQGLREEGVTPETPVSLDLPERPVAVILEQLLQPMHLTTVIEDDIVKVTSRVRAMGPPRIVVYSVGALLDPPVAPTETVSEETLKELADQLQQEVAPQMWDDAGGIGNVGFHPKTGSLIIHQVADVHEDVRYWMTSRRSASNSR